MTGLRRILRPHRVLWLIIVLGMLLRLWLIQISPLDPAFSNADDGDYFRRALRFALMGQYLDDAWLIRPPLHVFFFAAFIRLAVLVGQPLQALLYVQLAQVVVAAITTALGYGVARRLFKSEVAGLLFACFLAVWQPYVEQADVLFSELLYLFLFMLHVWLLLLYDSEGSHQRARIRARGQAGLGFLFLSSMALGFAALTRSPALYSLAFVVLWLLMRAGPGALPGVEGRRRSTTALNAKFKAILIALIGCLLVVLPWTARNYVLYGQLIPVDTLGQINLWLDLGPVADRTPNIEILRRLPQAERAPYAMAQARELLAERPLRILDNAWPNFQHIWKAQFIEDYFLKSSFFTRPLREMAVLGLFGDALWLVFTLSGLVMLVSRPHEGWHWRVFFLAWMAYSMLTVIVFHVEPRYLTPLWTLLALYGAGGLARLFAPKLYSPTPVYIRMLQLTIVLGFLGMLLSYRDYPGIIGRGMARERAMIAAEQAYKQGSYADAERQYAQALQIQPFFVDARIGQSLALAAQGQLVQAQDVIRNGGSRQADLLGYALYAIHSPDQQMVSAALDSFDDTVAIAGEDSQAWVMRWLGRPPANSVRLGSSADIGRIQGFHGTEYDGASSYRWLRGQGQVQLTLSQPVTATDMLILRLNAGQDTAVPLTVRINNGPAYILEITGGAWRRYILPLPASAQGSTQLQIMLSAPTFVPALRNPNSDDLRFLSLMMSEVGVSGGNR